MVEKASSRELGLGKKNTVALFLTSLKNLVLLVTGKEKDLQGNQPQRVSDNQDHLYCHMCDGDL